MNRNIIIQLNEVNIDYYKKYAEKYDFKNIKKTLQWNFLETDSEKDLINLEPWIQWTSFYASKNFQEHGIFHLGDNLNQNSSQFFDNLIKEGKSIGCVCPMNGGNSPKGASFYISDPWSNFSQKGSIFEKKIGKVLSKLVNDNNKAFFNANDLFIFLLALLFKGYLIKNFLSYFLIAIKSFSKPWYKAIFLDFFLANFHLKLHQKYKTDLSSVFLNCGAHIQHHYFLNSEFVPEQNKKNPSWYIGSHFDPIKDILRVYDKILGKYLALKDSNIFIITALSQKPSSKPVYYWRLNNHEDFLGLINIPFLKVKPRMSRDFLITFSSRSDLEKALHKLSTISDQSNERLFGLLDVNEEEMSIFVTLTYGNSIDSKFILTGEAKINLKDHFNFVAIKNGEHNSKGFCITNTDLKSNAVNVNIWNLSNLISEKVIS